MTQKLHTLTIDCEKNPTHSIIWMHGLGASSRDFIPILPHLAFKDTTRIIFPDAPHMPITINGDMTMPAWFDIVDLVEIDKDNHGIAESYQLLHQIYQQEIESGVKAENIIFAGFSQGGVMALALGLQNPCAGILAMSTFMPNIPLNYCDNKPSILHFHGNQDPIVQPHFADTLHQHLSALNYPIESVRFDMQHEICLQEVEMIRNWLQKLGF